jgi:hypothetical protein
LGLARPSLGPKQTLSSAIVRQQFLDQGRERASIIGRRLLGGLFQLRIDAHAKLRGFSLDHLGQSNRFALHCKYSVLTLPCSVYTFAITMQRAQGQIVETALITITETLPVALKAELELASDFARASKAKATQVAYCSDFRIFESWCRERGLSTLPATPATIAPSWRHKLALGSGLRLLGATSPRSNIQLRDRAILVVGFASAMRRSELVALKVEDLEWTAEGLPIQIRKGKTDQEGVGAAVAVPKGETGSAG